MKNLLIIAIYVLSPFILFGQNLEVEGKAKITKMDDDTFTDSLVVLRSGGELARRHVSSLPDRTGGWTELIDTTSTMKRVGIGTVSPSYIMDIVGASGPRLRLFSENANFAGMLAKNNLHEYFIGINGLPSSSFGIYDNTVFAQRLIIDATGNIGIGLVSPSEKLHVNGNVKVAGVISGVTDPIAAQDAATKAYVDLLEARLELLSSFLDLTIQQRLDFGETPKQIYDSNNNLLDSLYGKTYAGGLIAYLNTTTGSGLVAAAVDQSTSAEWGCFGFLIGGTSAGIGTGQANTTTIVDSCVTAGIAARLCDDLNSGAYEDWFLPSLDELNELYVNLHLNGLGGFSVNYWSSTEDDMFDAWTQNFDDGGQNFLSKYGSSNVRAVRTF